MSRSRASIHEALIDPSDRTNTNTHKDCKDWADVSDDDELLPPIGPCRPHRKIQADKKLLAEKERLSSRIADLKGPFLINDDYLEKASKVILSLKTSSAVGRWSSFIDSLSGRLTSPSPPSDTERESIAMEFWSQLLGEEEADQDTVAAFQAEVLLGEATRGDMPVPRIEGYNEGDMPPGEACNEDDSGSEEDWSLPPKGKQPYSGKLKPETIAPKTLTHLREGAGVGALNLPSHADSDVIEAMKKAVGDRATGRVPTTWLKKLTDGDAELNEWISNARGELGHRALKPLAWKMLKAVLDYDSLSINAQDALRQKEHEITSLRVQMDNKDKKLTEHTKKIENIKSTNTDLLAKKHDAEVKLKEERIKNENDHRAKKQRMDEMKRQLSERAEEVAKAQQQIKDMEGTHTAEMAQRDQQISTLRDAFTNVRNQLNGRNQDIQRLSEQQNKTTEEMNTLRQQLQEAGQNNDALRQQLEIALKEKTEIDQSLSAVRETLTALQAVHEALEAEHSRVTTAADNTNTDASSPSSSASTNPK
mmetsp:Transcript_48022/g.120221  ORF Transcript_48022/g.120221 Transcript_48022/m.120221 type:complete len:535 (-) Transcript_48022:77-1681(-)